MANAEGRPTWNDRVTWQTLCRNKKCVTTTRHYHTAHGKIVYMSEGGTAFIEKDGGGYEALPVWDLTKEQKL